MTTKDTKTMSKKELKDYINQNGFFFHIQCDKITQDQVNDLLTDGMGGQMVKTGRVVPTGDNIVVFKGIASQNYAKGEKSRNGYKYDQNGWDFSAYLNNPIILWQHDTTYGGIGNAISFWNDASGNLNVMFFVDLNTLDPRNGVQVKEGYVSAISTGAIAKEYMFEENETGVMYTEDDAEDKFGWENVWRAMWGDSDVLTLVVTAAEMIENSLVTIGSNENAVAMQNGIGKHFKEHAETYKKNKLATLKTDATATAQHCDSCEDPECKGVMPADMPEDGEDGVHCDGCTAKDCVGMTKNNTENNAIGTVNENSAATEDTPNEVTTTQEVEKQAETPATAEQAGDQSEIENKDTPVSENETKLADALELIEAQANKISDLEKSNADNKAALDQFKDEVYDTLQTFIVSHNDTVQNLQEVNTALKNVRVSKGLPHILRQDATNTKSPLAGLIETIKAKA